MISKLSFSIVTCTWNSAATLAKTIQSVQSLDYPSVQHIFVDGGSTDGTLEIVKSCCPDAIVLHNIKGGISHAMNVGTANATGDVIAHLHSDDYYKSPDVLTIVESSLSSGARWAFGNIDILRHGKHVNAEYPMRAFSLSRFAAGRVSVLHPAVFIRRSALNEVGGFDETLKYAMDIDLWFRLGARYQPVLIDRSLAVFREHDGSLSTKNKLQARQEEWRVRQRYFCKHPLETVYFGLRNLKRVRQIRKEMACIAP
jgi:glycosyltransferase involved in cell wall biosynthesis